MKASFLLIVESGASSVIGKSTEVVFPVTYGAAHTSTPSPVTKSSPDPPRNEENFSELPGTGSNFPMNAS